MPATFIERFQIEASDIAAECDPAVLLEWRAELVRIVNEISFQLDSYAESPFANKQWVRSANSARFATYKRLIEVCRRLEALGALPDSPSLAETAAEVNALRLEAKTMRATIADLTNQLAQARAQKAQKAKAPADPTLWERQKANYEEKIANLNKSLTAAVEGNKAAKARAANERAESVAQQFVALMKDKLPASEFLSLIAAAEVAASSSRAA